jgi:aminomethyltransferase
MENRLKQTPLRAWHSDYGAQMAVFGEYEMPLWYSSAKDEQIRVLTRAGIFDTSHMSAILVTGSHARELLQNCFSNDLDHCIGPRKDKLIPGRCVYGAFLTDAGHVMDDSILYMLDHTHYMVVVNSGMGPRISRHLKEQAYPKATRIVDLSGKIAKLDIQGPASAAILTRVMDHPDAVFKGMPYFSFKGRFNGAPPVTREVRLDRDIPVLISRTGYTGEFGFELFTETMYAARLWNTIFRAGEPYGLIPCGLAARDSLRAGAVLPLSHQDIGPWPFIHHPWPFALPFNGNGITFSKRFIGDRALLNIDNPEYTYPFIGFDIRKVEAGENTAVVDPDGRLLGRVLSCVSDMSLDRFENRVYSINSKDKPDQFSPRGLACGFVKLNRSMHHGQTVFLVDKRRRIKVMITDDIRPDRSARRPMSSLMSLRS